MTRQLRTSLWAFGVIFPFAWLLLLSFGTQWAFPAVLPTEWSGIHWAMALKSGAGISGSLVLSLLLSGSVAVVVTLMAFFVASRLAYHPWRRWVITFSFLPYSFAPVIFAASLQHYFLLCGASGTIWGVFLAHLLISFPYALLFFMGFWNQKMRAFRQLAATLGAKPTEIFFRVSLPIARGPLWVGFFSVFLISWFEYGMTALLGVGKIQTLTQRVFQYITEANPFYASLASVILVALPFLWQLGKSEGRRK